MRSGADLIVIGGGLHGLSAALQSARRGLRVVLLEGAFTGRHASGATAAGVRSLNRAVEELPLSLEAQAQWEDMTAFVGDDCGFHAGGQVQVAMDAEAEARIKARIARLEAMGMRHECWIGPDRLAELVPVMQPGALGAAYVARDGSADPHRTIRAFRAACLDAGVEILENRPVTWLSRDGSSWSVVAGGTTHVAPKVVNAAGAWGRQIAKLAGDPLDVGIKNSMMIVTERCEPCLGPVISAQNRKLSFKQTGDGTFLIGGGVQGRLRPGGGSASVDFGALSGAMSTTLALFPWVADLRLVRAWAGMEAATADLLPVIGPSHRAPGLIHAFGFSGHGFQLVPSVGRVIADLAETGRTRTELSAFDPGRLATNRKAA